MLCNRNHAPYVVVLLCAALAVVSCKKKEVEPAPEPAVEPAKTVEPAAKPESTAPPAPSEFPKLKIPVDNPQTPEKVALGHQLFFDKRLSVDGSRSCYSCHQNEHGNGGETPTAVGAKKKKLTRHSPVIWNTAYFEAFYWDGRAPTLEAQAKGAWGGGNMGVGKENLDKKAAEIGKLNAYRDQFAKVFPGEGATADTVAKAIAAYERTLICNDTAYDRYAKGDESALTDQQKEGWGLFMGKGQCNLCHSPPLFSNAMAVPDGVYYNVGIGTDGRAEDKVDVGRIKVSGQDGDWASFKVPSLRNVSKSAPYFHDGSVPTLEAAVKLMANGGIANKNKVAILLDRELTDDEVAAIVAFLGALDCGGLTRPAG